MFFTIYVIALVVCFLGFCWLDKMNHVELTVGDLILNTMVSVVPILNIAGAVVSWIVVLIDLIIRGNRYGGWLTKKVL